MKNMNILDIDDILTWSETYNRFIRDDSFWGTIERVLSCEVDDEIYEIFRGLQNRVECIESAELLSLRHRCNAHFERIYTHVAAYHACCPTNIDSYLCQGIIPANTEELIEKAKKIFNDPNAVTRILREIGTNYLDHGRGKIGFFISGTGSLESGYSHYLFCGSELLQCIARRLGNWAVQKISNQGTPTLFRCTLPISWLNKFTTFPMADNYALTPLVQLLIRLRWPEQQDSAVQGAFLLTRSVPKEYILEAINMTPFLGMKSQNE